MSKNKHILTVLLLTLLIVVGCKKPEIKPTESKPKITFTGGYYYGANQYTEINVDTVECDAGTRLLFNVVFESEVEVGLSSIEYRFEVVGISDELIGQGSLGNKPSHAIPIDYTIPSNMAGRMLKFKFKATDTNGNTTSRYLVVPVTPVVDYIGYFSPKEVDTVYNNAPYDYSYTFFSTYGVVFQKLDILQRINGSSSSLIATKLPNDVQNGAGVSYKYSTLYVPTFPSNSENIVETEYKVIQVGGYVFTKTHTLIVINN